MVYQPFLSTLAVSEIFKQTYEVFIKIFFLNHVQNINIIIFTKKMIMILSKTFKIYQFTYIHAKRLTLKFKAFKIVIFKKETCLTI